MRLSRITRGWACRQSVQRPRGTWNYQESKRNAAAWILEGGEAGGQGKVAKERGCHPALAVLEISLVPTWRGEATPAAEAHRSLWRDPGKRQRSGLDHRGRGRQGGPRGSQASSEPFLWLPPRL